MRIISGRFKGKAIKQPAGIRPTQDKVRKALFDILGDIKGLSFLDLYAGSGAVGLEALSQGTSKVIFVEKDRDCVAKIKQNISAIGLHCRIIGMDALEAIQQLHKTDEKFNIIFLDPPYYRGLVKKTLKTLTRYDIVAPSGLIICQYFKKDILPEIIADLSLIKQAKYGDTFLSFYQL